MAWWRSWGQIRNENVEASLTVDSGSVWVSSNGQKVRVRAHWSTDEDATGRDGPRWRRRGWRCGRRSETVVEGGYQQWNSADSNRTVLPERVHGKRGSGNWKDTVCWKKFSPEDSGSPCRHNLGLPFSLGSRYLVEIKKRGERFMESVCLNYTT